MLNKSDKLCHRDRNSKHSTIYIFGTRAQHNNYTSYGVGAVTRHSRQATISATHLTSYVFSKHSTSYVFRKRTPKHSTSNVFMEATQNSRQSVQLQNTRQAMSSGKRLKTVDKLSSGTEVQHTHNKLWHCGRRSKQSTISHVFRTIIQSTSYIFWEGTQVIRQAMSSGHELETVDKLSPGQTFNAHHRGRRSNQSTIS